MNIFNQLAQSTTYYDTTSLSAEDAAVAGGVAIGAFLFGLIFGLAIYVFIAVCLMKIFTKAGVPAWIAWVPFYNTWKILEIGGQKGFWAVLAIIPGVNVVSAVFMYIAMYHIGKKLGKQDAFVVLGIFLPYVWFPWLAFDKSTWNDAASTAPSLHVA